MKAIYESRFQTIYFDEVNRLMHTIAHQATQNMTEDEFRHEVLEMVNAVKYYRPPFMLDDGSQMAYMITPEIQYWVDEQFADLEGIVKKYASVVSADILEEVMVDQMLDDLLNPDEPIQNAFFDNSEHAIKWLLE
ncbi:hypothetical protein V6R21_13460 [Limibacter armeniacum]|uniref:hypothetical protein n=1 Tax=Limibacter armeniacum TaxID=466084 RepID=UPI002FE644D9